MLEPLWGKSLYSRSQALCEVLPGKAWAGTVIQEAVRGSLTCGALPTWIPLAPTRNTVGPRSHQGCWKVGWPHCLGRSRVLGQSFLCFYQAFQQKPGAVKPGSQGNRGPGQLLGWGTAPC